MIRIWLLGLILHIFLKSPALFFVNASSSVTYNKRSFVIDGQPTLLLSGSIHYSRIPPSDWENVFKLAKELGLNCIQTYIIWSEHEPHQGKFRWDGYADLERFVQLAAAHDLYVVARIGPYICGEYHFGGLPLWLRHVDNNNITCFRCSDPIWKREMQKWVERIVNKLRPYFHTNQQIDDSSSNRGPIIALQIENEYRYDNEYIKWSVQMAREITTDLPWIICNFVDICFRMNSIDYKETKEKKNKKYTKKIIGKTNSNIMNNKTFYNDDANDNGNDDDLVLCTSNGFWTDIDGSNNDPGPKFIKNLWNATPNQPAMWTEDQGWFDLWGYGQRQRNPLDQIYGIVRFIALGGSYHNFYMLTGGNNYAYKAGRLSTTAYAPDTVIDSYLLRHEPNFSIYQRIFYVLQNYSNTLLKYPPAKAIPLSYSSSSIIKNDHYMLQNNKNNSSTTTTTTAEAHVYGELVFFSNYGDTRETSHTFEYQGHSYFLPNHTVIMINTSSPESILLNTSSTCCCHSSGTGQDKRIKIERDPPPQQQNQKQLNHLQTYDQKQSLPSGYMLLYNWTAWKEPVGYGAIRGHAKTSPEQLNITNNDSDYLWYSFSTPSNCTSIEIKEIGYDGIFYTYINGILRSSTPSSHNNLGSYKNIIESFEQDETTTRTTKTRRRALQQHQRDHNKIEILSVAMGLRNWGVGPQAGKGIENVTLCTNDTYDVFETAWKLKGEELQIFTDKGSNLVPWQPIVVTRITHNSDVNTAGLIWFQAKFDLQEWLIPYIGNGAQPDQTAVVANLTGLTKGIAYINGFNLGRYWLKVSQCKNGECAPPPTNGQYCHLRWYNCGKPSQSLYHIPFEILRSRHNILTVFEETTPSSAMTSSSSSRNQRDLSQVSIEVIHKHPL